MHFDLYVPLNMTRYPYICLISRGSHTHHPPYPLRLPHEVRDDVMAAIRQGDVLSLTTRMLYVCLAYVLSMLTIRRSIYYF